MIATDLMRNCKKEHSDSPKRLKEESQVTNKQQTIRNKEVPLRY